MRSLVVGAVVAVTVNGCAANAGRALPGAPVARVEAATSHATVDATPRESPLDRHVDLEYQLDGKAFPSPLLRGTIGGRSTWLVVDTGTSYHALSEWLATDLLLPFAQSNLGKDHLGRDIRISVIERASISAGGWGMLVDQPLLVADVPEPFRVLNLGGFLSPQFLAQGADERVILDLQHAEMRVLPPKEAARRMLSRGGRFPVGGSRSCRATDSVPYRTFAVPAYVENVLVNLLIDTGAERTNLRIGSVAGQKLIERANGDLQRVYGAAGAFNARTLPNARVQVGEIGATADIELVPGAPNPDCPVDGVLGMDILRSCVLSLGEGPVDGRCAPEDAPDED